MDNVPNEFESIFEYKLFLENLNLIQGVIFGIILVCLSTAKKPSLFIGLFLLTWGVTFSASFLWNSGFFEKYPFLPFFLVNLNLVCFPFLYLYIKGLTGEYSFRRDIRHLYPGLVLFLLIILLNFILKESTKDSQYGIVLNTYLILVNFYIIFYLYKMIQLIKEHKGRVYDILSTVDGKLLIWLNYLIYAILLVTSIELFFILGDIFLNPNSLGSIGRLYVVITIQIIYICLTYWVVIYGIKQTTIWTKKILTKTQKVLDDNFSQYDETLYERLIETIERTKCYRNLDLNLIELAILLNIHHRKLYKIIKFKTDMHFNAFINKYRIEESKKILRDPIQFEGLTMDVLGENVGFKSKSSFYIAFKKIEKTTPSQFLKDHRNK